MSDTSAQQITFKDFKNSFFYGARSNMNYKFLEHLSEEQAALFIQDLFSKLGISCDDGKFDRIVDHIRQGQALAYADQKKFDYDDGPFTLLKKPVSESRIALMTSSGHFVAGDDPEPFGVKDMTQEEAEKRVFESLKEEPILSTIPVDTKKEDLRVRHGGYDICGAKRDLNVSFPLERVKELADDGAIGELADEAYSFVGACAQMRLLKRTGPLWVEQVIAREIDAVLLVPV